MNDRVCNQTYIGESRPRHRDEKGGSQFFFEFDDESSRGAIVRTLLVSRANSLHASLLIEHEKKIYLYGAEQGFPFAKLKYASGTSLASEMVGPNVPCVLRSGHTSAAENAAIIDGSAVNAATVSDGKIALLDGHLANHVIYHEGGLTTGRLRFDQMKLLDFPDAIAADVPMVRTLWCSTSAEHFPPEAIPYKLADEHYFFSVLRKHHFAVPGETLGQIVYMLGELPEVEMARRRAELETIYLNETHHPRLQQALNEGRIDAHLMNQFVLAASLAQLAQQADLPSETARVLAALQSVLDRMRAVDPRQRYANMWAAVEAIRMQLAQFGSRPSTSLQIWPALVPSKLVEGAFGFTDPDPVFEPGFDSIEDVPREPDQAGRWPTYSWLKQQRHLAVPAMILLLGLVCSIRISPTPEGLVQATRDAMIATLVAHLDDQANAESALASILQGRDIDERTLAKSLLEQHYDALTRRYLTHSLAGPGLALLAPNSDPKARGEIINQLQRFARLGIAPAASWVGALQAAQNAAQTTNFQPGQALAVGGDLR